MKKILSVVLSVALIIGIFPIIPAWAATVPCELKNDYRPGDMPENIFTGSKASEFYLSPNYNHHSLKLQDEASAIGHEVGIQVNSNGGFTLTANRNIPDPNAVFALNESTGYYEWDGVTFDYTWPLSGVITRELSYPQNNGNVVFAFDVYNSSPYTAPVFDAKINMARYYKYHSTKSDEFEFPVEYSSKNKGFEVTARTTEIMQSFTGTFIDNGAYKMDSYNYIIGMPQGTPNGAKITVESIYFQYRI